MRPVSFDVFEEKIFAHPGRAEGIVAVDRISVSHNHIRRILDADGIVRAVRFEAVNRDEMTRRPHINPRIEMVERQILEENVIVPPRVKAMLIDGEVRAVNDDIAKAFDCDGGVRESRRGEVNRFFIDPFQNVKSIACPQLGDGVLKGLPRIGLRAAGGVGAGF